MLGLVVYMCGGWYQKAELARVRKDILQLDLGMLTHDSVLPSSTVQLLSAPCSVHIYNVRSSSHSHSMLTIKAGVYTGLNGNGGLAGWQWVWNPILGQLQKC